MKELSAKSGLNPVTINSINLTFAKYPQIKKVMLYGSRAKGNYKKGSDIDLSMLGEDLTYKIQLDVFDDLDELLLPYKIDLSVFDYLDNTNLRDHIERVGVVFYEREISGLPKGWEIKKLDDLCQIELGKTPYRGNKSFWDTEKVTSNVWLSIADMLHTDGDVVSDSKEYITDKATQVSKIVKKGTLLLSFKLTLGRLAFAGKDLFTNEAIAALTIKDEKVIDKYFLYQFLSLFNWDAASEGDVKVKGKTLNKAKLKQIEVSYPKSLPEQKRIVAILDQAFLAINKAKANAEANLKNAKELFESILDDVLYDKKWEVKELGEVCIKVEYGSSTKSTSEGKLPVLRMGNIQNRRFTWDSLMYSNNEEENKQYSLKHNDVLFNRTNSPELVGKTAIYKSEMPAIFAGYLIRIHRKEDLLDADYLNYYLNSKMANDYGKTVVISSVNQANINGTKLKTYPIPLPPLKEQQTIVKKLDALSSETKKLEAIYNQKINDLEELKKSVLQKAFAGQLIMDNG